MCPELVEGRASTSSARMSRSTWTCFAQYFGAGRTVNETTERRKCQLYGLSRTEVV
jgi:hypothetical protein